MSKTTRLKCLMVREGLSINDIARICNRKRSTVKQWSCGKLQEIPENTLKFLELYFAQANGGSVG